MNWLVATYRRLILFVRHHWLTVAFIAGFIVDNLTLNRVDQLFDNIVLLTYVILAMVAILLLYAGIAERLGERLSRVARTYAPILMQYAFGGLLSGMLIFYGRSSSLVDSWPFMLLILLVIFGNETIKDRAGRLVYNLIIFFVGLSSYIVLVIPVLLGKMGPLIFIGSGILALVIMYGFFSVLSKIVPHFVEMQKRNIVFILGLIYVTLNFLYFTNLIPPIPLSLKHVGVYHGVERSTEGGYTLTYEKPAWWEWYRDSDSVINVKSGESIFCYASVFAPARLATDIYHRWEYYDNNKGEWIEHSRISYGIQGGRGEGYRGYTKISNHEVGEWRCTVETARGQIIGKETFNIEAGVSGELVTRVE